MIEEIYEGDVEEGTPEPELSFEEYSIPPAGVSKLSEPSWSWIMSGSGRGSSNKQYGKSRRPTG